MNCVFCDSKVTVIENELAYARYDNNPVNNGHAIFITKRHIKNFFDATIEEKVALFNLIDEFKKIIDEKYSPDGYNIGINCNEAAGQTVMHLHIHLIPRYIGDIENPRGGVRGIIPSKKEY